jgi:hypothetical protein
MPRPQRWKIMYPKRLKDWKTGKESVRWYQIGLATEGADGEIKCNFNSMPVGDWDGTVRLEPIDE